MITKCKDWDSFKYTENETERQYTIYVIQQFNCKKNMCMLKKI